MFSHETIGRNHRNLTHCDFQNKLDMFTSQWSGMIRQRTESDRVNAIQSYRRFIARRASRVKTSDGVTGLLGSMSAMDSNWDGTLPGKSHLQLFPRVIYLVHSLQHLAVDVFVVHPRPFHSVASLLNKVFTVEIRVSPYAASLLLHGWVEWNILRIPCQGHPRICAVMSGYHCGSQVAFVVRYARTHFPDKQPCYKQHLSSSSSKKNSKGTGAARVEPSCRRAFASILHFLALFSLSFCPQQDFPQSLGQEEAAAPATSE
eukprot:336568-Hanusia_phi.AAC.1